MSWPLTNDQMPPTANGTIPYQYPVETLLQAQAQAQVQAAQVQAAQVAQAQAQVLSAAQVHQHQQYHHHQQHHQQQHQARNQGNQGGQAVQVAPVLQNAQVAQAQHQAQHQSQHQSQHQHGQPAPVGMAGFNAMPPSNMFPGASYQPFPPVDVNSAATWSQTPQDLNLQQMTIAVPGVHTAHSPVERMYHGLRTRRHCPLPRTCGTATRTRRVSVAHGRTANACARVLTACIIPCVIPPAPMAFAVFPWWSCADTARMTFPEPEPSAVSRALALGQTNILEILKRVEARLPCLFVGVLAP